MVTNTISSGISTTFSDALNENFNECDNKITFNALGESNLSQSTASTTFIDITGASLETPIALMDNQVCLIEAWIASQNATDNGNFVDETNFQFNNAGSNSLSFTATFPVIPA